MSDSDAARNDSLAPLTAALRLAAEYRDRATRGDAEPIDAFLAAHDDLREWLEPLLADDGSSSADDLPLAMAPTGRLPEAGDSFGPYRIERALGRGGMGAVFLAEHVELDRRVALKLVLPERLHGAAARDRFRREARSASRLDHPAICTVYDVGERNGVPFLALQYVDGETLAARIRTRRASGLDETAIDAAPRLFATIARALDHAHEHGVVHRDVKPSNILLTAGEQPMLVDFGLAWIDRDDQPTLTRTGDQLGTPAYMAPEQIDSRSGTVGPTTDVWGLGVTLYEYATGTRPFAGLTRHDLSSAILNEVPKRVDRVDARIGHDLGVVVERCIEKDPGDRYASCAEVAAELDRVARGEPIRARPAGRLARARRWTRRNPLASGLMTALALASVLAAWQTWQAEAFAADAAVAASAADARATELQSARAREVFVAAEDARRRGSWSEAEARYDRARTLGFDAVAVQVGLLELFDASYATERRERILEALPADDRLGTHLANVLLHRGDATRTVVFAPNPSRSGAVARALELGLGEADAHYARALLATHVTEIREHLAAALRCDSRHRRANEMWPALLLFTEGTAAARAASREFARLFPNDRAARFVEAVCDSIDGDPRAGDLQDGVREIATIFAVARDLHGNTARAVRRAAFDPTTRLSPPLAQLAALTIAVRGLGERALPIRMPLRVFHVHLRAAAGLAGFASLDGCVDELPIAHIHLLRATRRFKNGNWDGALEDFAAASHGGPFLRGADARVLFARMLAVALGDGHVDDTRQRRATLRELHVQIASDFADDVLTLRFLTANARFADEPSLASEAAWRWQRLRPESPEPWVALAEAAWLRGDGAVAGAHTERALRLEPTHEAARDLRARLAK